LGPNLIGPGKWIAERLGVAPLAGAWVLSLAGFLLAAVLLQVLLRPDPLRLSRELAHRAKPAEEQLLPVAARKGHVMEGLRLIRATPVALWGTVAVTTGHVVMVAV